MHQAGRQAASQHHSVLRQPLPPHRSADEHHHPAVAEALQAVCDGVHVVAAAVPVGQTRREIGMPAGAGQGNAGQARRKRSRPAQPARHSCRQSSHSLADKAEGNDWQHRQQVDKHFPCRAPQHLSCGQPVEVCRQAGVQSKQASAGRQVAGGAGKGAGQTREIHGACSAIMQPAW